MAHEEYLRRNLVLASSYGAHAGVAKALTRLRGLKSAPKWLVETLEGVEDRASRLPPELAKWRNAAPDAPKF